MTLYVVTWTFMRHINRNREYKILTKKIFADEKYIAEFKMMHSEETQSLFKKGFSDKLKSYTKIELNIK